MRSLVDFQVLRSGKHLSTALERTRKRFLARMHPDVIHQLVLGLERSAIPLASHPVARVLRTLRSANMFDRQMADDFGHRSEHLAAMFARAARPDCAAARMTHIRIDPHALKLLLDAAQRQ